MSWERDPLWAKSRMYFERAFSEERSDPRFGLWCALGLELLARAAIASVSPTLLAEPDPEQKNLLYALNRRSDRGSRKSIGTARVFGLCKLLFPDFQDVEFIAAMALLNRRNDELHTALAAFEEYQPSQWQGGFYKVCSILSDVMGETLETLFGKDEAEIAAEVLAEMKSDAKSKVESRIAAHRKVFEGKTESDRRDAAEKAEERVVQLTYLQHHRVTCPACQSPATVQGKPFGPRRVMTADDEIRVQQAVSPQTFSCSACDLSLNGYAELNVANLGGQYTRNTWTTPEEYYGLVDPTTIDTAEIVSDFLRDNPGFLREYLTEYDNE